MPMISGEHCVGVRKLGEQTCLDPSIAKNLGACATCAVSLEKFAFTDPLTELPNRRGLELDFEERVQAGHPFGLLQVDIGSFKQVNDLLGYDRGDRLLIDSADLLKKRTREDDDFFVSRHGGDEFVILVDLTKRDPKNNMPDIVPIHQQRAVLEKIKNRLIDAYEADGEIVELNAMLPEQLFLRIGSAIYDLNAITPCTLDELLAQSNPKKHYVRRQSNPLCVDLTTLGSKDHADSAEKIR